MIIKETDEQYQKGRKGEFVSPSDIKGIKTPFQFWWKKNIYVQEQKTYFDVGTAFHTAVLEPEIFDANVTHFPEENFPDKNKRNKDGSFALTTKNSAAFQEFVAQHSDKTVLRQKDWDMIMLMVRSVWKYPGTPMLLQRDKAYIEHSYYTRYIWNKDDSFDRIEGCENTARREPQTMLVRTKADFVHKKREYAMDVKTAVNVDPDVFARDCATYEYDIQGAMICNIAGANVGTFLETFVVLAVEKNPPHQAVIYDIAAQDLMDASSVYIRRLNAIRQALNSGKFPGYEFLADNEYGMITLHLPQWYKHKQQTSKF